MATRRPHHVLLYGPPAAGKLTVATEFARAHDFRVLDNHVSVDVALRLFDFRHPKFRALAEKIWLTLASTAAESSVDVVSTVVYMHPADQIRMETLKRVVTEHGGVFSTVRLQAPPQILESRVANTTRIGTNKITDPARLGRMLSTFDLDTPINEDDLTIDTSRIAAEDAARLVGRHLGLEPVERPDSH